LVSKANCRQLAESMCVCIAQKIQVHWNKTYTLAVEFHQYGMINQWQCPCVMFCRNAHAQYIFSTIKKFVNLSQKAFTTTWIQWITTSFEVVCYFYDIMQQTNTKQ